MTTESYALNNRKKNLYLSLRILLSLLFLVSAVAKLYPSPNLALATFEVKQLYTMGFSEGAAAYFSRTLIGCEFALGFLLLQPHYLKRLVIPASFLMLLVFSIHLTYSIVSGSGRENCGCFGTLLPMTPLQALIKNIIAMGMLGYLFMVLDKTADRLNFFVLTTVTFASVLFVYLVGPLSKKSSSPVTVPIEEVMEDTTAVEDTLTNALPVNGTTVNQVDTAKIAAKPVVDEPKKKKSGFAQYFADIDKGKKILCFFAPGCEHCKETAKQLTQLKKQIPDFPEIRIIFMDEEPELIPTFFEFAGGTYPNMVMEVGQFWQTLGGTRDTPGVFYLWNGNQVKVYDGIDANAFKAKEFKTLVQKPWSEIKK